jgi:hypothetical protein
VTYSRPDIALNDEHMLILSRRLADFRTADLAARNDMVIDCTARIKRVWKEKAKFDKDIIECVSTSPVTWCLTRGHSHNLLFQHVRRYMFANSRPAKKKSIFSVRTTWTYTDVVVYHHRVEIDKLATELANSKSGSPLYLGCYRPALQKIEEGLTDDMRMRYRAEAKIWTEQKPPPSVQYRYVHAIQSGKWQATNLIIEQVCFRSTVCRRSKTFLNLFIANLGCALSSWGGTKILVQTSQKLFGTYKSLSTYVSNISCYSYDLNERLGGTSFKTRHDWQDHQVMKDFTDWVSKSFGCPSFLQR